MSAYEDAVLTLYRAPLAAFVAERKRLAAELTPVDKPGAARLAKLARPPVSAWVVNQLYWQARDELDAMFATAERLRRGDHGAAGEHREALARLRERAARLLDDAGHGATEAVLRRVAQTLAALAATGGFEPDVPGALAADRDPPGFEAAAMAMATAAEEPVVAEPVVVEPVAAGVDEVERERREQTARAEAARVAEEQAERRREAEHTRVAAARARKEAALAAARSDVERRERAVTLLKQQLADAEAAVGVARGYVEELERDLV